MAPLAYKITFLIESFHRKQSFVVLAMDAQEAINVATAAVGQHAHFSAAETVTPRWAESSPQSTPDLLSPAALAYYGRSDESAKTIEDLKQRCLDVRDAVNRYHETGLQSDLDELDRLMLRVNSPDLFQTQDAERD